jgi:hypothetical protein
MKFYSLLLALVLALSLSSCSTVRAETADVTIEGRSLLTADQLTAYITKRNPGFDPAIARAYITIGRRYGIRGDIALCQAIIETGWFRYAGSSVKDEDYNYCGLGVVKNGVKGSCFHSVEEGVTAHIQHLYAYCCDKELPRHETIVDPRFGYVKRGVAPTWRSLSGRWAMNEAYGDQILDLMRRVSESAGQ